MWLLIVNVIEKKKSIDHTDLKRDGLSVTLSEEKLHTLTTWVIAKRSVFVSIHLIFLPLQDFYRVKDLRVRDHSANRFLVITNKLDVLIMDEPGVQDLKP